MKPKLKKRMQKSSSSAKNGIEEYFQCIGMPLENIAKDRAGMATIIGSNRPSQAAEGEK